MRYSPYLAEVSYAFSKTPHNYSEMALHWSEEGLEAVAPAYLQYTFPGSNIDLPLPFQKVSPTVKFLNLPDNQAAKGALSATFSNGDALQNSFVDVLFSAFLARLGVKYMPYQDDSGKQALAAQISWQIDPLLINRVDHYTMQSPVVADNQALEVRYDTAYIIHSMVSGQTVPITLSAIGFDGLPLGSLTTTLYVPALKIIPTRANVSGMGYGKQMDSSGVQEIYQVNHNKTIAQMTMPTQQHAQETKSLGDPLSLMNPSTVVSGNAREYVNAFDPNDHNQAFDYTDAVNAGAKIAPQATATFTQQHQGNYTLEHGGTLNKTTNVDSYTELTQAPQINNTIQNYQGNFSGDTFSKIVDGDYYEQVDNETRIINEHSLEAPAYQEDIDNLQEEINNFNVNTQSMMLQGDTFTHNGTMFLNGKFDLGYSGGYKPQPFVLPKRTPHQSTNNDDLDLFVATVFGETDTSSYIEYAQSQFYYREDALSNEVSQALIQQYLHRKSLRESHQPYPPYPKLHQPLTSDNAIMAVASVIKNRMNARGDKLCQPIVSKNLQFDAYVPLDSSFQTVTEQQWNTSNNFVLAYAYLVQNKISVTVQGLGMQSFYEKSRLMHIYNLVKGIYDGSVKPITDAVNYFSPIAQLLNSPDHEFPGWYKSYPRAKIMDNGSLSQTDDFYFALGSFP